MLPEPKTAYGLYLPDQLAANWRPDIGIVLCAGSDVHLAPGDMVAVRGYDGSWFEEFSAGSYETANQVRAYGHYSPHSGSCFKCKWSDSIVLTLDPETEEMTATNNNLIIRRDRPVERIGDLILSDNLAYREGFATVESVGPKCYLDHAFGHVQPGARIHYDSRCELEFAFGGDPDMAIIPDSAVNFVVTE